jgi:hypothetical protein
MILSTFVISVKGRLSAEIENPINVNGLSFPMRKFAKRIFGNFLFKTYGSSLSGVPLTFECFDFNLGGFDVY